MVAPASPTNIVLDPATGQVTFDCPDPVDMFSVRVQGYYPNYPSSDGVQSHDFVVFGAGGGVALSPSAFTFNLADLGVGSPAPAGVWGIRVLTAYTGDAGDDTFAQLFYKFLSITSVEPAVIEAGQPFTVHGTGFLGMNLPPHWDVPGVSGWGYGGTWEIEQVEVVSDTEFTGYATWLLPDTTTEPQSLIVRVANSGTETTFSGVECHNSLFPTNMRMADDRHTVLFDVEGAFTEMKVRVTPGTGQNPWPAATSFDVIDVLDTFTGLPPTEGGFYVVDVQIGTGNPDDPWAQYRELGTQVYLEIAPPPPVAPSLDWTLIPGSDVLGAGLDDIQPLVALDEGAAAVVGNIAYIVSGYVYNPVDAASSLLNSMDGEYVWPFIERFNLSTKQWMPRLSLPRLGLPATSIGPVDPNSGVAVTGPWDWPGGTVPMPDAFMQVQLHIKSIAGYASYDIASGFGYDANNNVPAGIYYVTGTGTADEDWNARLLGLGFTPRAADPNVGQVMGAGEGNLVVSHGGRLYFGGGDSQSSNDYEIDGRYGSVIFQSYDPATGTFTRLADFPFPVDYNPYGVIGDTLYLFAATDGDPVWGYDFATDTWTATTFTNNSGASLRYAWVEGHEYEGRLYFATDHVFIFDPEAMTLDALPWSFDNVQQSSAGWLVDGVLHYYANAVVRDPVNGDRYVFCLMSFDISTGVASGVEMSSAIQPAWCATVVHNKVPYLLSGIVQSVGGDNLVGVWRLGSDDSGGGGGASATGLTAVGGTLTAVGGTLTVVGA